jgi:murein DD-endopeptidase MepM/ murein hydrolase activator NlpD
MSPVVELLYSRRVPHAAALALISLAFAGCSADMSTRLQSLSNPFGDQSGATASVPPAAVPAPQVEREDLPQNGSPPSPLASSSLAPPVVAAPQSYPTGSAGTSGGGRGVYEPPAPPRLETTGTVPPSSVAASHPPGGTRIIVGTSDTLEVLAHRYHVTAAAILAANGYNGPRTLSPGQSLIIPHPTATAVQAAPAVKRVAAASHVVHHGDTLHSIARHYHVSVGELARANKLNTGAKLKLGTRLTVPTKAASAEPAASAPRSQKVAALPPAAPKTAALPSQSARLAQAGPLAVQDLVLHQAPVLRQDSPTANPKAAGALPTFRWPVRGKVIASYGAKTNGKANDGINLAVPEGTPVKAAEDGVVAYAGNELKGYGNLILVRHANGYVTAYAHASELLVKRGDPIKRGQVIAKSGQSGEVASPQLHFEIRKGSAPVDPLQFLNGA